MPIPPLFNTNSMFQGLKRVVNAGRKKQGGEDRRKDGRNWKKLK